MTSGISLANKCQILFGVAVLAILAGALAVPWIRTGILITEGQAEAARQMADAWLSERISLNADADAEPSSVDSEAESAEPLPLRIALIHVENAPTNAAEDPFLVEAIRAFQADPAITERSTYQEIENRTTFRYARAVRESHFRAHTSPETTPSNPAELNPTIVDPLRAVLLIDRTSIFAERQLLLSRIYIIAAGVVGGLLAILAFYLILTKLILSPVRRLRETAERLQSGDLTIRAQIATGDEFQQLSEAFNAMLDQVEQSQAKLHSINQSLDLKLGELSEANVGLYESNRLKGEFLANVSHELRTPLNSIIGFAELLDEMARTDPNADPKRRRYLQNILNSGRALLDMINELLDMAKIEAGRMEVNLEPTSIADLLEGLAAIMKPQAQNKQIELRIQAAQNLPSIESDPGKLQQILYNFLSNAIKFTPPSGTVTVTADRVTRQDNTQGVRLGVSDTGPGIPYDMQDTIFEKFRQVDASHTRRHAGTGLGLAIARELAELLGASVSLVSEPGRGATFFVDLPLTHQTKAPQPLMS